MKLAEDIWSGKKVALIGLGVSNQALIGLLQKRGAILSGRDRQSPEELGERYEKIQALGIDLVLGANYLTDLEEFDLVMVSPGVPRHLPELVELEKQGKLCSEIALVFANSPVPIFGITGSSGKTTTTSLVGEILKASGIQRRVGGNIGNPLITELEDLQPSACLVLELSSFQLDGLNYSPKGALITNVTENHLDLHLTMNNYIAAKQNIYRHQGANDFLVLNHDDPLSAVMAKEAPSKTYYFSLVEPVYPGAYLAGNELVYEDEFGKVVFAQKNKLSLLGEHNVANFLGAAVLSHLIGASWEAIKQVGENFKGVDHRLEFIREVAGVKYYNDSIATTPNRTEAALQAFESPIILLAGGSDKQLSFSDFGKTVHSKVKKLIIFGATAPKIRQAVLAQGDFPIEQVQNLEAAIALAVTIAKPGDVILLSPACASFDQYPNYVARGNHFRELVQNLKA